MSSAGLERSIPGTHRLAQREEGRRQILRTRNELGEQGGAGAGNGVAGEGLELLVGLAPALSRV